MGMTIYLCMNGIAITCAHTLGLYHLNMQMTQ